MTTKILADFQICISVPSRYALEITQIQNRCRGKCIFVTMNYQIGYRKNFENYSLVFCLPIAILFIYLLYLFTTSITYLLPFITHVILFKISLGLFQSTWIGGFSCHVTTNTLFILICGDFDFIN